MEKFSFMCLLFIGFENNDIILLFILYHMILLFIVLFPLAILILSGMR